MSIKVGDLVELRKRGRPTHRNSPYIGLVARIYDPDFAQNVVDVRWTTHFGCTWGYHRMVSKHLLRVISKS